MMVFRDEMIEQAAAAFASLRPQDAILDQLMQVFAAMMSHHERDTDLAKILLREIMFPANEDRLGDIAELMEVVFTGLCRVLETAVETGALRKGFDSRLVAEGLFSVYFMILLEWLRGRGSSAQALARLRQHLALTLSGLE